MNTAWRFLTRGWTNVNIKKVAMNFGVTAQSKLTELIFKQKIAH